MELTARPPLEQIRPMLAEDFRDLPWNERDAIWSSPDWIAEPKLNGVRLLGFLGVPGNRFTTRVKSKRSGLFQERTDNLPHLRDLPLGFLADTVLDGELVLERPKLHTGHALAVGSLACTMAVVNCSPEHAVGLQRSSGAWAAYYVFDLIRDRGHDVGGCPFWERRSRLAHLFREMSARGISAESLKLVPQVSDDKRSFYASILESGGEGVMLKRLSGPYKQSGRSRDVLKVKKALTVDAFVSGFTEGRNGFSGLVGSLLVSVTDEKGVRHEIAGVPCHDPLDPPGSNMDFRRRATELIAGKPGLNRLWYGRVVEVEALEWNKNHRLVHARILRWRTDKAREECVVDFSVLDRRHGLAAESA